jgi:hypothetical protein
MVEDIFLLYGGGAAAPEVPPQRPSSAILMHEVLAAAGDPFTSAEGFCTKRIGLFRTCWNATYEHSPEGQVIQDAD